MTASTRNAVRKDPAVHVSLSSDSIVKQHKLLQNFRSFSDIGSIPYRANTFLPGLFNRVVLGPRNSRKEIRASRSSGVAVDGRFIGPASSDCQHVFFKNFEMPGLGPKPPATKSSWRRVIEFMIVRPKCKGQPCILAEISKAERGQPERSRRDLSPPRANSPAQGAIDANETAIGSPNQAQGWPDDISSSALQRCTKSLI